jgi:GH25 family lysozyme M1 (1,4-beta-N-acetylmuramidase)
MIAAFLRRLQGERPGMRADAGRKFYGGSDQLLPSITISNTVRLADVSYYQGVIDFNIMKAAGIAGAIIRAGQRNWVDTRFKENWQKAKAAGMPRGSYWLYDSREDPKKQAALWWAQIESDPGELVHVADLEENYGGAYGSRAHMKTFLQEFMRLSRLPADRIAIYTGFFWWADRVGNDIFFSIFPLWLAWYATMGVVRVPGPWEVEDLLFWQYTSSGNGTAYGVSSLEIDLNWFCCSPEFFTERFGVEISFPTPPDGGPMWYRVNTAVLNIREGRGASYRDLGDLLKGDLVEVDDIVGGWGVIRQIKRGGSDVPVPMVGSSYCSTAYLVKLDPQPTDPPPVPDPVDPPDYITAHWVAAGVTKKYLPE